nr:PREDICTED: MND1-interacting protein 1-like [Daucus carota subsp. sativus]
MWNLLIITIVMLNSIGTNEQVGSEEVVDIQNSTDENDWSLYCKEEELEGVLLSNLKFLYREALCRLCEMGYQASVAFKALLSNGHCYGEKDVLSNILDNTVRFLDTGKRDGDRPVFDNMTQLIDLSLAALIVMLQKSKPHMSKGDAMLYLLLNDLNLDPSVKDFLNQNAAAFSGGYMADFINLHTEASGCGNASFLSANSSTGSLSETEAVVEQIEQQPDAKKENAGSSMMDKICDLNLDENIEYVPMDQRVEMITDLLQQVKDLEGQVKERRAWAEEKAKQAERTICCKERELEMLRVEREEKKGKQTLVDSIMMRINSMNCKISDIENDQRKLLDQMRCTSAALGQLELECEEMNAEFKASELSASESLRACAASQEKQKKCLKRLVAQAKKKTKLHADIVDAEQQILQQETQLEQANWKEAQKDKESALVQLEEERREHKALHLKIETDFLRHKDDMQRLELELSRLKVLSQASQLNLHSKKLQMANTEKLETEGEFIARIFSRLDNEEDYCSDRKCFNCEKEDVSVVFLPCTHQVLCISCSDSYGKGRRPACPCCGIAIQQKIRVFAAESS